jgi:hypothetical protein
MDMMDLNNPARFSKKYRKINQYAEWDLCANPSVVEYFTQNPDKINWSNLSKNYKAIQLLEANPDKINWNYLSMNKNAIKLLEKNKDKIDWDNLSLNSSIFE